MARTGITYRTLDLDGQEVNVEVHYSYSAGSPGSWYRNNGDPGDPPEAPEVEILKIITLEECDAYTKGADIVKGLSDEILDKIETDILEDSNDN